MTTTNLLPLTPGYIGVVLPDFHKGYNFHVKMLNGNKIHMIYPQFPMNYYIPLDHESTYTILALASDIGESVAEMLVAHDLYFLGGWSTKAYCNYEEEGEDATDYTLDTAIESLHSKCRSLGHKPGNVLIVKNHPLKPIK